MMADNGDDGSSNKELAGSFQQGQAQDAPGPHLEREGSGYVHSGEGSVRGGQGFNRAVALARQSSRLEHQNSLVRKSSMRPVVGSFNSLPPLAKTMANNDSGSRTIGIRPGFDARKLWQDAIHKVIAHNNSDHTHDLHGRRKAVKKLSFLALVKAKAKAEDLDMSTTLSSAAYHSTAVSAVPKVAGNYRHRDADGKLVKSEEVKAMPGWMIHPFNPRYRLFLMLTVIMAAATGVVTPAIVAFQTVPGLYPYRDFNACFNYANEIIFGIDMIFSFCTAYYDAEVLITNRRLIAKHYLRLRFWVDFMAWFPFDFIIIGGIWPGKSALYSQSANYFSLLQLLKMMRLYRIRLFFKYMEYNLTVSLLVSTLWRNLMMCLFVSHWGACAFYYIGAREHFTGNTWLGTNPAFYQGLNLFDKYVFSLYWSVVTFATVGYGDFSAKSTPEAIFCIVYILCNIFINSYILGTITLLVVKGDERTGRYRERSGHLKQYSGVNELPKELQENMQEHLRLHFNNEEASDEHVLGIYPSTIRRRILRHLYLPQLRQCYLFHDCKQKFLDVVLSAARVELFMPQVEILAEGDHVNELMVVVSGIVEIIKPALYESKEDTYALDSRNDKSVHLGTRALVGEGECFGEVAFFTEIAQMESVRSVTVVKVLTVPRKAYEIITESFPISVRTVLENLAISAEQAVKREFQGPEGQRLLRSVPESVQNKWASSELADDTLLLGHKSMHSGARAGAGAVSGTIPGLTARQEQAIGNMFRVKTMVAQHVAKVDEERTTDFLYAATKNDAGKIRQMLRQGFDPDTADYDGRTALMLACVKGNVEVVRVLLGAGCDPSLKDNLGSSALSEACKHSHDDLIKVLRAKGADLGWDRVYTAGELCTLVFRCDIPVLRRYLAAGADVDAGDYDDRTALHISAAESNLQAVKVLVEEGGASMYVRDRWGNTPLDEARRVRCKALVEYLELKMGITNGSPDRRGAAS